MARLPAQFVPHDGGPVSDDTRLARAWAAASGVGAFLALLLGDGVARLLGVDDAAASPARAAVALVLVSVPVVLPLAMAWHVARRSGEVRAGVAAVAASLVGGGYLVIQATVWLVAAASSLVDRF
jgi:hypothetical protein